MEIPISEVANRRDDEGSGGEKSRMSEPDGGRQLAAGRLSGQARTAKREGNRAGAGCGGQRADRAAGGPRCLIGESKTARSVATNL